jgi:hypothetical protein
MERRLKIKIFFYQEHLGEILIYFYIINFNKFNYYSYKLSDYVESNNKYVKFLK